MSKKSMALLISIILVLMIPFSSCSLESDTSPTNHPQSSDRKKPETISFSVMLSSGGVDNENTVANQAWLIKMEELMDMTLDIDWSYVPGLFPGPFKI